MTKKILISLLALFSLALATLAQAPYPIYYPLFGKITAPEGVTLEGRTVRFWRSDRTDLTAGVATAIIGPDGSFTINIFDIYPDEVVVGGTYRFDVPFMGGYGISPPQTGDFISGKGYDEITSPPWLLALTSEVAVYASISGTVKDTAGNLISTAEVSTDTTKATSASDGTYTLMGLATGTYTLTASKADYFPASQEVTVTSGEAKTGIDFTLASVPVATKIQVKVTDATLGVPIANADVEIIGGEKAETDATGTGSFVVNPGTYNVKVSKQYYIPKTETVTVAQGETKEVAIALKLSVPPKFESLYFGNRVYQKRLVERGEKFYIPRNPKISCNILAGDNESGVKAQSITLKVDPDQPLKTKTYDAAKVSLSNIKSLAVAGIERIQSLLLAYTIAETDALDEGKHSVTFYAENDYGLVSSFAATVEVLGGPLRIVDVPITFPSPFSPSKDKEVTIQYTLSDNANVDIYIYSIAGELIKRFSCPAGTEGGTGQLNKVKWNGIMDVGGVVGNGIYVGTIVSRNDNKVLGKFKLNVFD